MNEVRRLRIRSVLTAATTLLTLSAFARVRGQTPPVAETVRGLIEVELPTKATVGLQSAKVTLNSPSTTAVSAAPFETFTDRDGMYYLSKVPAGPYTLEVDTPAGAKSLYRVDIAAAPVFDVPPIILKQENAARVWVYGRGWSLTAPYRPTIYVNGVAAARIEAGRFFVASLQSTGRTGICASSGMAFGLRACATLEVVAGKTYYIRVGRSLLSVYSVVAVREDDAKSELQSLRQIDSDEVKAPALVIVP